VFNVRAKAPTLQAKARTPHDLFLIGFPFTGITELLLLLTNSAPTSKDFTNVFFARTGFEQRFFFDQIFRL
jgi:hypothetical protein